MLIFSDELLYRSVWTKDVVSECHENFFPGSSVLAVVWMAAPRAMRGGSVVTTHRYCEGGFSVK